MYFSLKIFRPQRLATVALCVASALSIFTFQSEKSSAKRASLLSPQASLLLTSLKYSAKPPKENIYRLDRGTFDSIKTRPGISLIRDFGTHVYAAIAENTKENDGSLKIQESAVKSGEEPLSQIPTSPAFNSSNTFNASNYSQLSQFVSPEQKVDYTLHLPNGEFLPEPAKTNFTNEKNQAAADTGGYYILQLWTVADDAILDSIRATGLEIIQYVPNQAFIVYDSGGKISSANAMDIVRWSGPYLPEYKLPSVLKQQLSAAKSNISPPANISRLQIADKKSVFDISIFKREQLQLEAKRLAELGGSIISVTELPLNFFNSVRIAIEPDRVSQLANLQSVVRIDAWQQPAKEDEVAAEIVAGNYTSPTNILGPGYDPFSQFGVTGSGVTVAVVDDGVGIPGDGGYYITSSNAVNGPLRGASSGASGHGHLQATIIAGSLPQPSPDANGFSYGKGIAPSANIVNIPFLRSGYTGNEATTANDAVSTSGPNGVKASISNNSWGNGLNSNQYDSLAAQYDGLVLDASSASTIDPLAIIFSAGNSGTSGLTRPKVAKNIISVAAAENLRPTLPSAGGSTGVADNMEELPDFSSRGPAADGRIKPDITAPGDAVTGGRSGPDSLFGNIDAYNRVSSGTSHAAPQVAGAAALFTEFWKSSHSGQNPSPSLIKAAILNSGVDMSGNGATTPIPNGNEGWGRINLKYIFPPAPVFYVDETESRSTLSDVGSRVAFTGVIADATRETRITLVWSDPPALADPALVNNLDLKVQIGSSTYLGNVFLNGSSTTGGSADSTNNVEEIRLPAGIAAGTPVTIEISAVALNGNGKPGNSDPTDQGFSIAAFNINGQARPALVQDLFTLVSESNIPANGAPDPGEQLTVSLKLANIGPASANNVTASLRTTGGVSNAAPAVNYGNIASAGSATGNFQLKISPLLSCGSTVTLTWDIFENGVAVGTAEKTLTLGTPYNGTPATFSNASAITIPASDSFGAASPYPSTINVSGFPSNTVSNLEVKLNGLSHSYPADIDILLVNPSGKKFILMSDVIGGTNISNRNFTFIDSAGSLLPSNSSAASGNYKPTNYGNSDNFSSPAPSPPYESPQPSSTATLNQTLAGSSGGNPNGVWSLYVYDDSSDDTGSISGGWSLTLTPQFWSCSLNPTASPLNLNGIVRTRGGRPISLALVTVSSSDGKIYTARTNTFGRFSFSNLPPGALYFITTTASGFQFDTVILGPTDSSSDIVITGSRPD
jgi:subtilisin-like proprotein convertase family protein